MSNEQKTQTHFQRNFMLYATLFFKLVAIILACWMGGWKMGAIIASVIFAIIAYIAFVSDITEQRILDHLRKSGIEPPQDK